jgi:phenylpyruvate tautomerase PptA (4-oxalocrotonate tautomerase family)
MPYFNIETNAIIDESSTQDLTKKFSVFVSEMLGKPEQYVMISIRTEANLIFGGSDQLAAFVQLKSIGLPKERCAEFSEKICIIIDSELGIPKDRIFIDFHDLERSMFGWDGKTF